MLLNLHKELKSRDISLEQMASFLNSSEKSLENKLSGMVRFTNYERIRIRRCMFPSLPESYLFQDTAVSDRK